MNIFSKLLQRFKAGGSEFSENQALKALYKYFGIASPAWVDDNFEEYVRKGMRII